MTRERSTTTKNGSETPLSHEEEELSLKLKSARSSNLFWHLITMGQIAAIAVLLIFTMYCEDNQRISIRVPDTLLAGYYPVDELPDLDLLSFGEEFINLVATYQPSVAEKQFLYAFDMSSGEFKDNFKEKYVIKEVKEIKRSKRSQIFYADYDPVLSRPSGADYVIVSLDGELERYADGRSYNTPASYQVKLKSIPHSSMNDYGISVVDLKINTGGGY